MIHRDDLVGILIAALTHGRSGQIYNAVDDEPISQLEFYRWLADSLGRPLPLPATANRGTAKRGATNKRVSNRKLRKELGHQFQYPDFRQGFRVEIQRLRDA